MSLTDISRALDSTFPRDASLPMSHLRRFAKRSMLPQHLLTAVEAESPAPLPDGQTLFVVIPSPLPEAEELKALLAPFAPVPRTATPSVISSRPSSPASPSSPTANSASPEPQPSQIRLLKTRIPIYPPFNTAQAELWSRKMWPVIFNPAAPRSSVAPPPLILNRVLKSIKPRAGHYLALARKVAQESKQSGRGRGVGAVIVDPTIEEEIEHTAWVQCRKGTERWMDAVLSVGGDARYARSEAGAPSQADQHPWTTPNPASTSYNPDLEGGPDLHALMRATELVARRRREDDRHLAEYADSDWVSPVVATDPQLANQLSPLESYFLYEVNGATTTVGTGDNAAPPMSPKKRKLEDPDAETTAASLDVNPQATNPVDPWTTPIPAPPPPSTALADPDSTNPSPNINHETSSPDLPESSPTPQTSRIRTRSQGGYLCTDLDIYLSHEPCLCCSMGMLLSRFRAIIFPRSGRMPSGGIVSEPVVEPTPTVDWDSDKDDVWKVDKPEDRMYYGLHWRKELNWRALGFEFLEGETDEEDSEIDWGDSKGVDGNDEAEDKEAAEAVTWGDDGEDEDRSFHA